MHYAAENLHWAFYRTSNEKIAMTSEICNNEEEKEQKKQLSHCVGGEHVAAATRRRRFFTI